MDDFWITMLVALLKFILKKYSICIYPLLLKIKQKLK